MVTTGVVMIFETRVSGSSRKATFRVSLMLAPLRDTPVVSPGVVLLALAVCENEFNDVDKGPNDDLPGGTLHYGWYLG